MLHWFRRFDDYQALKLVSRWQPLPEYRADEFTVGIMGAGVLGRRLRKVCNHRVPASRLEP